ncbi:hypothetical protein B0T22DRAFT_133804 [Podospora appendiculata]|uniref:CFEM domain-containing protein n=1 Tax=Podospora appendiculata TaxID=314037 RepID=A0AAE1CBK1_9PEZI|nr:hypothetical protein B0T22DRAFT_133804 [Podospora appendiculata]
MKIPAILLSLALASVSVVAQDGLPDCAKACANTLLNSNVNGCGTDAACICKSGRFLSDIACCLVGACDAKDQSSAATFASGICALNDVTGLPTAVVCSTTASASATTSKAALTTTTAAPTTTAATHSTAVTSSPSTSTAGSTTGSESSSAAATNAAASTTTTSKNLSPRHTAAAGLGAIGGIMAAVAML